MERLHRIEACGTHRGVQPEDEADTHRHDERQHDRRGRHDRRPAGEVADRLRQADADDDAEDATGQRDDRRLDQELADDVALARADGAADADLARPLHDAGEHDVHDADAADQ